MVAEVAHDVADVEPRGEVRGDAAQRLGPAQAAARLLGRVGALDRGPRACGRWPGRGDGRRRGPSSTAPAMTRTPHGCSPPGMRTTSSSVPMPEDGRRAVAAGAGVDRLGRLEGLREQVAARRERAAGRDPGPSTSVARETRPPGRTLPDPDQRGAGRDAHPVARLVERRSPCRSGTRRSRRGRPAGRRPRRSRSASGRGMSRDPPQERAGMLASATAAGVSDAAAVRKRWRSTSR